MAFVLKAEVADPQAQTFVFRAQKTMYGGKGVSVGDVVFLIASETDGGQGLVACGRISAVEPTPRRAGVERQTPRVSLTITATGRAKRPLGRAELKGFTDWDDGRPETELNFKFYRQATDKLCGVTEATAAFLEGFF